MFGITERYKGPQIVIRWIDSACKCYSDLLKSEAAVISKLTRGLTDLNMNGVEAHSICKTSFCFLHFTQGTMHAAHVTVSISIGWIELQRTREGSACWLQVSPSVQGASQQLLSSEMFWIQVSSIPAHIQQVTAM